MIGMNEPADWDTFLDQEVGSTDPLRLFDGQASIACHMLRWQLMLWIEDGDLSHFDYFDGLDRE